MFSKINTPTITETTQIKIRKRTEYFSIDSLLANFIKKYSIIDKLPIIFKKTSSNISLVWKYYYT